MEFCDEKNIHKGNREGRNIFYEVIKKLQSGDFRTFEVTDTMWLMDMFKTSSSYPILIIWLLVIFISLQSLEKINLVKSQPKLYTING